jgi:hypothetical protein
MLLPHAILTLLLLPLLLIQVSLTIWDQDTDSVFELALKTQQAQDMAAIILDHINAIMNNNGKN